MSLQDSMLLNYYKGGYSETEIFDKHYENALQLLGGDKLLKPSGALNSISVRKTSTQGVYKVIINEINNSSRIKIIDESQLLNNRFYCAGTISKIDEDKYEITYFDSDDEITIEHFDKESAIRFIKSKKMVFQI